MTEVTFSINADHKIIGFEVSGHVGFARRGRDIVCAAISALTINTVNTLTDLVNAQINLDSNGKKGHIRLLLISEPDDTTELIFRSLELGIKGISNDYGSKYCKVTYKED